MKTPTCSLPYADEQLPLTNEEDVLSVYASLQKKIYSYKRKIARRNLSFLFSFHFHKKRLIFCIFILNFLLPFSFIFKSIYILIFLKSHSMKTFTSF